MHFLRESDEKCISELWEHATPEIKRLVVSGDYTGEKYYRAAIYRQTEYLRREIQYLNEQLPPYLELRADEILQYVAVSPEVMHTLAKTVARRH